MDKHEHLRSALQRAAATDAPPELVVSNVMHAVRRDVHSKRLTVRATWVVFGGGLLMFAVGVIVSSVAFRPSFLSFALRNTFSFLLGESIPHAEAMLLVASALLLASVLALSLERRSQ